MANESGPPKMVRTPTSVDAAVHPLHLAVYGDDGVGKTQLALSFPKPLVVNTDHGLVGGAVAAALSSGAHVEAWTPEKYRDLNALYFWLKRQVEERGYETIVIDTLNTLAWVLLHESMSLPTKTRAANESEDELHNAEQQDFNKVATAFELFLGKLKLLSQATGVNLVITSAVREIDPEKNRYKRTFDVQPAVDALVRTWADVYGELAFIELPVPGGKPGEKAIHRVLHTNAADKQRRAKTRYAPLHPGVVDPTFSKIRNLIDEASVTTITPEPEKGA